MGKSSGNTFSKYAKKESSNVRKCLVNNKKSVAPKQEYVSNKKQQSKKPKSAQNDDEDDDGLRNGRPAPLAKNIKADFPTYETMPEVCSFTPLYDAGMFSRLMYPNPVCFLTTLDTDSLKRNVMTISWLSPANNYGGFIFVIHRTRHSATNLIHHKAFNLSVANASQLELLSNVGKSTGRTRNKFDGSVIANLNTTSFGRYSNDVVASTESATGSAAWTYLDERVKEVASVKHKKAVSVNAFMALGGDSSDDEDEEDEDEGDKTDVTEEAKADRQEEKVTAEDTTPAADVEVDVELAEGAVDATPPEDAVMVEDAPTTTTPSSATVPRKVKVLTDPLFIAGSVAHLRCTVQSVTDAADAGHYLVIANITEASVHPQYWTHNGKCLAPVNKDLPPLVSFLGSQQFGVTSSL